MNDYSRFWEEVDDKKPEIIKLVSRGLAYI